MALTEEDLAKLLIQLRQKVPEIYRHIIGLIIAVSKTA